MEVAVFVDGSRLFHTEADFCFRLVCEVDADTAAFCLDIDESDMVLSVVGEELGFAGCLALMIILSVIIIRIAIVAKQSRNITGALLCYGTVFMIGAQTIINIGMCLMLLPSIGITLPFMSAGGSSNMCIYFGIGIAMSVYRANRDRAPVNFRLTNVSTPFA